MGPETEEVVLGLGANEGNPKKNILKAVELLEEKDFKVIKISSFYRTNPTGNPDQPDFTNAAVLGATTAAPHKLLQWCKDIEVALGRDLERPRWSPRPIDIDILFYGRHVVEAVDLLIPHPRLAERLFALVPAAEAAPDFVLPDGATLSAFYSSRLEHFDFSGQIVEKLFD